MEAFRASYCLFASDVVAGTHFHPEEVREIVRTAMIEALPVGVPLEVDIRSGNNWLEAH